MAVPGGFSSHLPQSLRGSMGSKSAKRLESEEVRDVAEKSGIPDFDRLIHEKTRLAIVTALAANETLSFNQLKEILNATSGNVSVHARKLQLAKYIRCRKSFAGRVPRTEYSLTPAGHRAFQQYLDHMDALIRSSRG